MAVPEVRGDPHAVDGPWLTEALEACGVARGARVLDVAFGGLIGTGQAARSARFHLTWSDPDGRPASVVGKFPSADEGTRSLIFATGSYAKEWLFYDRLARTVDVRAPRCHVARFDADAPDFVLILEDLAGSRPGDQIEGLAVDQVALAVEQAAALHAPRFGDPTLGPILFGGSPVSTAAEAGGFCQTIYTSVLDDFLDRFGPGLDDEARDLVLGLAPHVERWFHGTDTPPTLVHLDFRADNLLFGLTPQDPPIVVVDFQSLSLGVGASDLAYVISGSLPDPDERGAVEGDLVADYRDRMAGAGVELSAEVLWRDYRHGSLWGVIMTVMASAGAERTERGDQMFRAMAQRHARQAVELEALAVLG